MDESRTFKSVVTTAVVLVSVAFAGWILAGGSAHAATRTAPSTGAAVGPLVDRMAPTDNSEVDSRGRNAARNRGSGTVAVNSSAGGGTATQTATQPRTDTSTHTHTVTAPRTDSHNSTNSHNSTSTSDSHDQTSTR